MSQQDDTDGQDGGEDDTPDGGGVLVLENMSVRILADRCATCVFRPGNPMHLRPGRLDNLIKTNVEANSHVTCHDTLLYGDGDLPPSICHGYFKHPLGNARSGALRLARAMLSFTYYHPFRKELAVPLNDLIERTGITTVVLRRTDPAQDSTGWQYRRWTVRMRLDGRRLQRSFEFGDNGDDTFPLTVAMDQLLSQALRVVENPGYDAWAAAVAGEDRSQWESRQAYMNQVRGSQELRRFLGEDMWEVWMGLRAQEQRSEEAR